MWYADGLSVFSILVIPIFYEGMNAGSTMCNNTDVSYWFGFHQDDISSIFEAADADNSGTLTVKEFQEVVGDILVRYPQVELYLKSHHMSQVTDLLKDDEGNNREEVDIEAFKSALCHVDSQMKSLPATAQVHARFSLFSAW